MNTTIGYTVGKCRSTREGEVPAFLFVVTRR